MDNEIMGKVKPPFNSLTEIEKTAVEIFNKTIKCTDDGRCNKCDYPTLCIMSNKTEILGSYKKHENLK